MKERSLVVFTILSQTAVGAFWTLGVIHEYARRHVGPATADALTEPVLRATGAVMVAALLAAFFHLGTPIRAWRALANLRSSWLSREILSAVLFTGSCVFLIGLQWLKIGTLEARNVLAWVTTIIGLGLIVCMSLAYGLRTIPAWNSPNTLGSFAVTALLLGGLGVGVVTLLNSNVEIEMLHMLIQFIAWQTVVLLGLLLALISIWLAGLAAGPEAATRALARMTREHNVVFRLRLALAVTGILFASFALSPWWELTTGRIGIILAFVAVLASEVLGRLLFYTTGIRQGV